MAAWDARGGKRKNGGRKVAMSTGENGAVWLTRDVFLALFLREQTKKNPDRHTKKHMQREGVKGGGRKGKMGERGHVNKRAKGGERGKKPCQGFVVGSIS